MAIIIPSKNIFNATNTKIRDNLIERIEVKAVKALNEKNTSDVVFSNSFIASTTKEDSQEKEKFNSSALGGGDTKYMYAKASITPEYLSINEIKIPVLQGDKKVSSLLLGESENGDANISYSISGIIQKGTTNGTVDIGDEGLEGDVKISITYEEATVFSLGEEELTIKANKYKDYSGFDITLKVEDTTNLSSISSYTQETDENGVAYLTVAGLKILCGIEKWELQGDKTEYSDFPIEGDKFYPKGDYTYYQPQEVEITVYGTTIGINLQEKTVYVNGEISKKVFSVDGNELMQITNTLKTTRETAIPTLFGKTQQQYVNGKETSTIRCSISDYFDDTTGEKIIAVDNSTDKMVFNLYDTVLPMVRNSDGIDVPMSTTIGETGQVGKVFSVLGTKIFYDGAVWQELSLQETTETIELPEEQVQLITPRVTISGYILTISNVDANTQSYTLYVNNVSTLTLYVNEFDLSTLNLVAGAYSISVVATAEKYKNSEMSLSVIYVVEKTQVPTIFINGDILTITTMDEGTEKFIIFVDGEEKAIVDATEEDYITPTEGIAYELSTDGTYYICTGIGEATDTDITISSLRGTILVKSIGDAAFRGCESLTSVVIPSSVTDIGYQAFANCYNLTSVAIRNGVTSIGDDVFTGCGLTSIEIPDSVTSIGNYAFAWCQDLTSVVIGEGVTSIGNYAFIACDKLETIKYNGMKNQWSKIKKGTSWASGIPATKVICKNGTVFI